MIPGLGTSPGGKNGNPVQYSCLENPLERGATAHRVAKSQAPLRPEHVLWQHKIKSFYKIIFMLNPTCYKATDSIEKKGFYEQEVQSDYSCGRSGQAAQMDIFLEPSNLVYLYS